jgi:hypothetical protein
MQAAPAHAALDSTVDLRDALTRRRLEQAAVDVLHVVEVVRFDRDWWDGQAHSPCLVVRGGRHLLRVVEWAGEPVVVPFDRRTARRWLADLRRPRRAELGLVAPATGHAVAVDADGDVRRCAAARCGALVPAGGAAPCPLCGATDDAADLVGARAGRSIPQPRAGQVSRGGLRQLRPRSARL